MSDVVPDTEFLFSIRSAIGTLSANKSYKVSDVTIIIQSFTLKVVTYEKQGGSGWMELVSDCGDRCPFVF
jgi:hypothetical protein